MSETKQYQWNETVDITIRGARVDHHADGELWIQVPGAKAGSLVPLTDAVAVTLVEPADGPAQPGDLWADHTGTRYVAYLEQRRLGPDEVMLHNGHSGYRMAELCEHRFAMKLVYREPAPQAEPAAPVFETGELDGIAAGTPTPVVDPLAAAAQQLREATDGASFMAGVFGLYDASKVAAQHDEGFHGDCDPASCADAEKAVAELHGESPAVTA